MFNLTKRDTRFNELTNFDKELDDMFTQFDTVFNGLFKKGPFLDLASKSVFPKTNVRTSGKDVILELAIPYYDPKGVTISLDNDILTVSGSSTEVNEGSYVKKEVSQKAFSRSWQVPPGTKDSQIDARYDRGVLYVTVKDAAPPEVSRPQPKTITIKY